MISNASDAIEKKRHDLLTNNYELPSFNIQIIPNKEAKTLTIIDNGIGVEHSIQKKSSFEGDHRSQGMEITSKRIQLIKKLSDFDITLEGPEEIYDENHSINGTRVLIKMKLIDFDF